MAILRRAVRAVARVARRVHRKPPRKLVKRLQFALDAHGHAQNLKEKRR